MEKNDSNKPPERGRQGAISDNDEAVRYYKPLLLKALDELQSLMPKGGDEWKEMENLKAEVFRETRGVVLYHKIIELNKVITEQSRGL